MRECFVSSVCGARARVYIAFALRTSTRVGSAVNSGVCGVWRHAG